jgi:hypothetical protein
MSTPFVKVSRTINAPVGKVFDYAVPVDLTHIFPPQEKAPGIVHSTIGKDWNRVGLERTNTFSDGSTSQEKLTEIRENKYFSYYISEFTAKLLSENVDHIIGEWHFIDNGNQTTSIEWTYTLFSIDDAAKQIIESTLLNGYHQRLDMALTIIKQDLEGDMNKTKISTI